MATETYIPLATVTLTGNDTQVLFSSIPNTYKDLVIVFDASATSGENMTPTINGSGTDFSWIQMQYAATSNTGTNNSIGSIGTGRNLGILQFFDYSATDKHKSFTVKTSSNASDARLLACRWAQTAAINSIGLSIRLGYSWTTGSKFSLYGIHG